MKFGVGGKPANKHLSVRNANTRPFLPDENGQMVANPKYRANSGRATKKTPCAWDR